MKKKFLSITKLLKSDILRVIHLVDMDGAFVTDDCIEYSNQEKVSYNILSFKKS